MQFNATLWISCNSMQFYLVLHKIQDFQESCLGLVLKARQDQDKTVYSRSRSRQDQKCQDQDKTRLARKFQEILSRVLKILEFIFFTGIVQKKNK